MSFRALIHRWSLRLTVFAMIATFYALFVGNQPLTTGEAPRGNVSLQWARSPGQADAILKSWSDRQLLGAARRLVRRDFAFIAAYVALLVILARRGARAVRGGWVRVAHVAGGLAIAAGALDIFENLAMLQLIAAFRPTAESGLSAFTTWAVFVCSVAKFVFLGACIGLLLAIDVRRVGHVPSPSHT